jgi:hypothetical protein
MLPRIAVVMGVASTLACNSDSSDQLLRPVVVGMTSQMAPYYDDGNLTLYEVQIPVALPVRRPSGADLGALGATPKGTAYPRAPFLLAEDESVEIHYVLSNVDTVRRTVWLLVDPWNEFVRYSPGVTVVNDEVTTPNEGYDLGFLVEPKSRIEGTITADDVHEIAIKLASVERLLASMQMAQAAMPTQTGATAQSGATDAALQTTALANHIFDVQNRSNGNDPQYTPWIPPVIAGITGFDLGLRTQDPANVAVEITVDVTDLRGDRFVAQDTSADQIGIPKTVLSPPAARF